MTDYFDHRGDGWIYNVIKGYGLNDRGADGVYFLRTNGKHAEVRIQTVDCDSDDSIILVADPYDLDYMEADPNYDTEAASILTVEDLPLSTKVDGWIVTDNKHPSKWLWQTKEQAIRECSRLSAQNHREFDIKYIDPILLRACVKGCKFTYVP